MIPLGILSAQGAPKVGIQHIQTVELTQTTSTIDLQNIPQNFQHLRLFSHTRGSESGNTFFSGMNTALNNDSNDNNYITHAMIYNRSTFDWNIDLRLRRLNVFFTSGISSNFVTNVTDFLDYSNPNKRTTIYTQAIKSGSQDGYAFSCMSWRNSSAVNRISITRGFPSALEANTSFSLYGIREL